MSSTIGPVGWWPTLDLEDIEILASEVGALPMERTESYKEKIERVFPSASQTWKPLQSIQYPTNSLRILKLGILQKDA